MDIWHVEKKFTQYLIYARPYSWINAILLTLLGQLIGRGTIRLDRFMLLDVILAVLTWSACMYLLEYFHKDVDYRTNPPLTPSLFLYLIVISLVILYRDPRAIIYLLAICIIVSLYAQKSINKYIGSFSFLIRGLADIFAILFIASSYGFPISNLESNHIKILVSLYLVTSARNLVGDIRDISRDKYTFPKLHGVNTSFLICLVLLFVSILTLGKINGIILVLILSLMMLKSRPYQLHRIFVLLSSLYIGALILEITATVGEMLLSLIALSILLNTTYELVPRNTRKRPDN